MTPLAIAVLAALPCVYWTQGADSRAALDAAGIVRICVPPELADAWRAAGVTVTAIAAPDLAARDTLAVPGVAPRAGIASPTRSPWINANGWRFLRKPDGKYLYEVRAGKAALAAAEAFAYGADAVLTIDRADLAAAGAMLKFLEGLPSADLPPIADLAVVDDGSAVTGEVMNLLARRNLLFQVVKTPASPLPLTIAIGSTEYPASEAADPSAFAQKVRRQLTDERRSLRVFGSEVVICRLTGTGTQARLHLLNYGGREIEGLRIRVRGAYAAGEAHVAGAGRLPLTDHVVADGATEFSLPRLAAYAVVDLRVK
jgi:hypothetical protein